MTVERVTEATVGRDPGPGDPVDFTPWNRETAIAALDLLSHWWSRPSEEEVALWAWTGDLEDRVASTMSDHSSRPTSHQLDAATLLDEYERLFVGPGPVACPPYESYWRNDVALDIKRSLMGPCTADLNRLYAELGLEVTPETRELPDHLTIELEALAYALSFEEHDAVARALFGEHLTKWVSPFCRAVAREATLPFYKDLANLSASWKVPTTQFIASLSLVEPSTD